MAPDLGLNYAKRILAKNRLDEKLAEKTIGLIANPDTVSFSDRTARRKSNIGSILPNGQRMTERIDRLVIRANDIFVLDYKTDWNVPDTLEADHPHVVQLAAYAMALGQAYSGKTIRAAILWTSLPRLDWIADETLKKAISDMAAIT